MKITDKIKRVETKVMIESLMTVLFVVGVFALGVVLGVVHDDGSNNDNDQIIKFNS